MTGVLGSLLNDLRGRGVRLQVEGATLVVEAPVGTLTETDCAALKATKPAIIRTLELERRLLGMSTAEFEQSDLAIEIRVPWSDATLWWVPRVEHVASLVAQHIHRGRIYTAKELTNLTTVLESGLGKTDLPRIAALKSAFGASIISAEDDNDRAWSAP